jgi:general stress protein 26
MENTKQLADLLRPGTTLMVGTLSPSFSVPPEGTIHFRPLTVADVQDDSVRILVDSNAEFVEQARPGDTAFVTVSDTRDNVWASLNASMHVTSSDEEIDDLWNPFAAAYFEDGRESNNIAVLHLKVSDGRYWSTPSGRLGELVSIVRAKLGNPEDSGEHGSIAV